MEEDDFIGYVGDYKVHDSKIEKVINSGNQVTVLLRTQEGGTISVRFPSVHELIEIKPEGMIIYAICEIKETAPYRKFIFINTDEEDEASLEVAALEYYIE